MELNDTIVNIFSIKSLIDSMTNPLVSSSNLIYIMFEVIIYSELAVWVFEI